MIAVFAAATLLLAGGAGLLATLLVTPRRGSRGMAALLAVSVAAVGLGLLLVIEAPAARHAGTSDLAAPGREG